MFAVLFEVQPKPEQWDAYLENAKLLRPELEQIDGFVDNIRYKSLTRDGWLLSLSNWRDEKAVVRWRTTMRHHMVQQKGRDEIFADYHLRVAQITADTKLPPGQVLTEQRLDETQTGDAKCVTLIDAKRPEGWASTTNPADCAEFLGLDPYADGLIAWDVFDAVLTPGDLILMISWRDRAASDAFDGIIRLKEEARRRRVRVIRDYGMYDRREAPQYYPDAKNRPTIHS
jgi:heme-degrading monooxygenase HmoA